MDLKNILQSLSKQYPNRKIIINSKNFPTEILCEVEPTASHPNYSVAIAVIDKTHPHKHIKTTETYEVIRGILTLNIDGNITVLNTGEKITIKPNQVHEAEGKETWVRVISKPGWTKVDHLFI
ncbi:hypothetical protein AUK04_04475 [Candidatus Roizmanbacteria bacterium CG2_30_33_16]|uniref:Cupin 2 conserved barrel domain-containing protein n=4 Tax=Candidatus Roizmaniibacteriota TaxID=1752723 RepID=A0A2H0C3W8_9BACT|nr:MAG: hypothetical protein AUK04_04475 [Candidatus Roizmanbacteria bacterium CG2_30_33_16]PIP64602.1 MAG: hypothetical protein COW96_01830 [Candidatus Roizmanbacteria bacterium CG22_combo_CG10-13_8_21_14_all_33_16]PIX72341.1 MAG: hypothetical protein COZ39_03070 [Candidatus Roizmanbacteria bacterium CG_4_10_14_3_um_filter_33_21]PJB88683.1 MAG: hypothetical protein CO083_02145 [Candidatus Roizmanbacteria bacterium CG_4_9_14_0_8_um_filter_34_12]